MWYKIALKGHKGYYSFNDLSYELIQIDDEDKRDDQYTKEDRTISYILKAYDLEHMDKDKPVGKMELDLDFYPNGKKQLHLKLVRTDDWHEGMGVAINLYKWLNYNFENFNKPDKLVSNPFNLGAEKLREKIIGEPNLKSKMHEYELDYSQGKLDI
jgi:hypothetical protein